MKNKQHTWSVTRYGVSTDDMTILMTFAGSGSGRGAPTGDCTIEGLSRTSHGPKFGAPGPYNGKMEARGAWYGDTALRGKGFG